MERSEVTAPRRPSVALLGLVAVVLTACETLPDDIDPGVQLTSSVGSSAELRVVDQSGFLVSADGVSQPVALENLVIEPVPDRTDAIRVSWIATTCEQEPRLTVDGESLDALSILVDRGPLPPEEEGACPTAGIFLGVDLVFSGEVSADDVEGQIVGE